MLTTDIQDQISQHINPHAIFWKQY